MHDHPLYCICTIGEFSHEKNGSTHTLICTHNHQWSLHAFLFTTVYRILHNLFSLQISDYTRFTSVAAANGMVSIRPDFYGSGFAYNGMISVHVQVALG